MCGAQNAVGLSTRNIESGWTTNPLAYTNSSKRKESLIIMRDTQTTSPTAKTPSGLKPLPDGTDYYDYEAETEKVMRRGRQRRLLEKERKRAQMGYPRPTVEDVEAYRKTGKLQIPVLTGDEFRISSGIARGLSNQQIIDQNFPEVTNE